MNPYFDVGFFEFFYVLWIRLVQFCLGKNIFLAEDELQILVLSLLSISCALVGSFLTLRKMTMFANSLSHTVLIGIVLSFLLFLSISSKERSFVFEINQKLIFLGALISAAMTYFLIEIFHKVFRLQKDASIGFVFTFLFALGILFVAIFARNSHIGLEVVMGHLDAIDRSEVKFQALLAFVNICLVFLLYRAFVMTSFDQIFSKNFPVAVPMMTFILALQTSLTTMGAYKAVGALLFLTFLTAPILSAKVLAKNLKSLLMMSCGLSIFISLLTVALSRHILTYYNIALSTGGLCSTLLALSFPAMLVLKKVLSQISLKSYTKIVAKRQQVEI